MGGIIGAALISGGVQLLGGLFGASAAKRKEQAAQRQKQQLNRQLTRLENNRQEIINPYENATDLSGMLSNPMENLSVATQAAEMQIEEADISLANTLDTLRASGASAGGATALAQAALKSKMGVSANIEQQEAQNEKLRAQGEQQLQTQIMAEKQRMQGLDAAGKQFMFGATENRETAKMDRISTQISGAEGRAMQASADGVGAISGMVNGLGALGSSYMTTSGKMALGGLGPDGRPL